MLFRNCLALCFWVSSEFCAFANFAGFLWPLRHVCIVWEGGRSVWSDAWMAPRISNPPSEMFYLGNYRGSTFTGWLTPQKFNEFELQLHNVTLAWLLFSCEILMQRSILYLVPVITQWSVLLIVMWYRIVKINKYDGSSIKSRLCSIS